MKVIFTLLSFVVISSVAKAQCGVTGFQYSINQNTVTFVDNSIASSGVTIASYYWDFGDGSTAFIQNPIHAYAFPGAYIVKHSFIGTNGCHSDTLVKLVVISSIVPITLEKFTASLADKNVQLKWETANENNFSHFEIQKSADVILFNTISTVYPSATKVYSYTDGNLLKATNYYRLKMIDKDGRYKYSKTVSVNNQNNNFSFSILSNPIKQGATININLNNFLIINTHVEIFDMTGSLKASTQMLPINGRISINKDLPQGIYSVKIYQSLQQSSKILFAQ